MSYWRCGCGAQNSETADLCEMCGSQATKVDATKAGWNGYRCAACGDPSRDTSPFHTDTPCVEDRGKRLCPACWIPALKRRATCEHLWPTDEWGTKCATCAESVVRSQRQFKAHMAMIESRSVTL